MSTSAKWTFSLAAVLLLGGLFAVRALVGSGGAEPQSVQNEREAPRVEPPSETTPGLVRPEVKERPKVAETPPSVEAEPASETEPEAEPEPVEEPEPAAVQLRLKVVDDLARPLPGASVRVRGPIADDGPSERALDEFGELVLTLQSDEDDERVLRIDASAPGRTPVQRVLQYDNPLLFEGGELRLVLEPEASVEVIVVDDLGEPAASAVVVLIRVPDERKGAPGATRLVTDAKGQASTVGLTAGEWSAQIVAWRDYDKTEPVPFTLEVGERERLELEAVRWPRSDYASGRVVGPGEESLTPEESDGLYLRQTDEPNRTTGIDADGGFFVKSVDAELSSWVLVRGQEVASEPFDLSVGRHDVVVVLHAR